jgi:hypothetical protein
MEGPFPRKSCFVIAPVEAAIEPFLEALREHRIAPFFISEFLKSADLAISQVRSAFRSVDLVIAFLLPGYPLANITFEIGMAVGLARPLLIFVEQGVDVPIDLVGMSTRAIERSDIGQFIAEVERFIEPSSKDAAPAALQLSEPPEFISDRLPAADLRAGVRRIRDASAHASDPRQLEVALSTLLTNIGWTVVEARPSARAYAPDLAVWIDEVQKDIGNPLALEVKQSLSPDNLNGVVKRLTRYVATTGAKAGVVLYGGARLNLDRNVAQTSPPIFAFSIDEFASLIERKRFPAALKTSLAAAKQLG